MSVESWKSYIVPKFSFLAKIELWTFTNSPKSTNFKLSSAENGMGGPNLDQNPTNGTLLRTIRPNTNFCKDFLTNFLKHTYLARIISKYWNFNIPRCEVFQQESFYLSILIHLIRSRQSLFLNDKIYFLWEDTQ